MAKNTKAPPKADPNASIPRIKLGEVGTQGLKVYGDRIYEQSRKELNFPACIPLYKRMSYDATISAALNLFETMIKKADWYIEPPNNYDETQKAKAEFIQSCLTDMDHSFLDFISEATSYLTYGFSVHEKVFRRRYKENGSLYDDGYVGIKKLAIRSQDTISGWKFSDDGRELTGVTQDLTQIHMASTRYAKLANDGTTKINIPRSKFLLIRYNPKRGNPEGDSPLRKVYFAWKYRTEIEETEAIGVARDMGGLPVFGIPPKFMSPDATPEEKATYEQFMEIGRNLHNNEQSCVVYPLAYDPDSKMPLFDFKFLGVEGAGGKMFNTQDIILRYDNKILTALFADILKLGQDGSGSFALSDNKMSLVRIALEARLQEVSDVINNDLIPQLFALNGWTDTDLPVIKFELPQETDIEKLAKALQQVSAVGLVELDRDVLNVVRDKILGLPEKPESDPVNKDNLTMADSRSGDGMEKGSGNGTSNKVSKKNNSSANKANK